MIVQTSSSDVVEDSLIEAVLHLQLKKGKVLEMYGTAVVCASTGLCLIADHRLNDLPRRSHMSC